MTAPPGIEDIMRLQVLAPSYQELLLAHLRAQGWMIVAPGCVGMPRSLEEAKAMHLLAEQYIRNTRP